MSFTRLKYDVCEEKKYLKETVGPGQYYIGEPINCGSCFQKNPSIIMQKSGISLEHGTPWRFYGGPIDVESELRNLPRSASNCPEKKEFNKIYGKKVVNLPDCFFPVNHTRLNDCVPRGVSLNRFEYPCKNPQANLEFPGCWREPSRLNAKDNYKVCYKKPKINEMSPQPINTINNNNKVPIGYNLVL